MSIPREEQESVFVIDGEDNDYVQCYSCSVVYVRKLQNIAESLGIEFETPFEGGIRVRLPIKCLLLREPKKTSPEARERASKQFKTMWQERRDQGSDDQLTPSEEKALKAIEAMENDQEEETV